MYASFFVLVFIILFKINVLIAMEQCCMIFNLSNFSDFVSKYRAAEIQLSEVGKKQLWPGELRTENATVLAHLASHNLVCIPQLCSGSSSQFFKLS